MSFMSHRFAKNAKRCHPPSLQQQQPDPNTYQACNQSALSKAGPIWTVQWVMATVMGGVLTFTLPGGPTLGGFVRGTGITQGMNIASKGIIYTTQMAACPRSEWRQQFNTTQPLRKEERPMPESNNGNLQIAILAKLIVFGMISAVAINAFHASYVLLGLSFIVGSLLQALIPPRGKGLLPILAISTLFTLIALILQKWYPH